LQQRFSPYLVAGDWFAGLCLLMSVFGWVGSWPRQRMST
jgi:hypothetical protein